MTPFSKSTSRQRRATAFERRMSPNRKSATSSLFHVLLELFPHVGRTLAAQEVEQKVTALLEWV